MGCLRVWVRPLAQLLGHVMLPWRPAGGTLGWIFGGVRTGLEFGRLGGGAGSLWDGVQ